MLNNCCLLCCLWVEKKGDQTRVCALTSTPVIDRNCDCLRKAGWMLVLSLFCSTFGFMRSWKDCPSDYNTRKQARICSHHNTNTLCAHIWSQSKLIESWEICVLWSFIVALTIVGWQLPNRQTPHNSHLQCLSSLVTALWQITGGNRQLDAGDLAGIHSTLCDAQPLFLCWACTDTAS